MRRENFLENVWLGGIEGKMMVRPRSFLLGPPKSFLPKMWRKLDGENLIANNKNAHVQVAHGPILCSFYFYFSIPIIINVCFLLSFFFSFCFPLNVASSFFVSIFFSLDVIFIFIFNFFKT